MQRIFIGALARPGFVVECVRDGREALERFLDEPECVDVFVTDHRMPRLDGHELVAALRRCGFGGPVIVVAAAFSAADRAAYAALGAEQVLLKPVALEVLRAAVEVAARLPA
jgi:DNA-binding response OmpR family regulator